MSGPASQPFLLTFAVCIWMEEAIVSSSNSGTECESETEFIGESPESERRRRWRWKGSSSSYSVTPAGMAGPRDRGYVVYVCMIIAGAGFLFPWSSYVTAIDYFFFLYQENFPQVSVAIPMTYLVSTWIFTGVNVSLVTTVPLHARIGLGYVLFLLSLVAIPFIDLMVHHCILSIHIAYYFTIFSIAVVGVGSGVQQSSYYGLAGMLPRRYPQAVMVGESVATSIVSITRVITKSSTTSERFGAIAFFVVSIFFILACVGCQQVIRCNPFVRYHTLQCRQHHNREGREGREGINGGEEEAGDQLKLLPMDTKQQHSFHARLKAGLHLRWKVVVEIWQLLVAVFVAFFLTLLLFPGLVSLVQYCPIGDWTPILLVAVFNVPELIAKWVALLPPRWSSTGLLTGALLRLLLVPPILLLISPSPSHPIISSGTLVWAVLLVALLGFSSGYFGSLPMIVFSRKVKDPQHLELAGTIMTLSLLTGLMMGSVLAYALTPLTSIASYSPCSSNVTELFNSCTHNNSNYL